MLMSSAGLFLFDWDKERISIESVKEFVDEFNDINKLKSETIECPNCAKRKLFDVKVDTIDYCNCGKDKNQDALNSTDWQPYIERKRMIVWRKEEKSGLYAYKGFFFFLIIFFF